MMTSICLNISDLSICCNESHLLELFQEFGKVIGVVIQQTQEGNHLNRFGFVTVDSLTAAENSIRKLNNMKILGRKIGVSYAGSAPRVEEDFAEITFSYQSKQIEFMIYEQTLRDLFSAFGCEVEDAVVTKLNINEIKRVQSGSGHIRYPLTHAGVLACKRAVAQLSHSVINDVVYRCELSSKLVNTLRVNAELDFPYAPQRPVNTSSVPVEVDVGFKLPYMPLRCFSHLLLPSDSKQESPTSRTESRGAWLSDPQDVLSSALQTASLSDGTASANKSTGSTASTLTTSSGSGSSNADWRTTMMHSKSVGHIPTSGDVAHQQQQQQQQHPRETSSMSEERMALLFQKPAPHVASHLQRNMDQQSGQIPVQFPQAHPQQTYVQQFQQQQQHHHHQYNPSNMYQDQQQQQWQQQQVVTSSAQKQQQQQQLIHQQQQSSRQIGKLQPQQPNQTTPLFSNARYNPTTRRKPVEPVDPQIAATAAAIAAHASAALKEVSVAPPGVALLPSPPPTNAYLVRSPPPQNAQLIRSPQLSLPTQQYLPHQQPSPSPIQSYQLPPRLQQHHTSPIIPTIQHQSSPPTPWQQARGMGDVGLQHRVSLSQPTGRGGHDKESSNLERAHPHHGLSYKQTPHSAAVPSNFQAFEAPLQQRTSPSNSDFWQQQQQNSSQQYHQITLQSSHSQVQPRESPPQSNADSSPQQRLYERAVNSSAPAERSGSGLGLAPIGSRVATTSSSFTVNSSIAPAAGRRRDLQSELFEMLDFEAPQVTPAGQHQQQTAGGLPPVPGTTSSNSSSEYDYSQWY